MATTQKYREGLANVGSGPIGFGSADGKPVIWLHAVSVGEVLAVSRLVEEIGTALPSHRLLISTTTRTGQDLARTRFGAERVFYCPLDLPWAVRAYLNALQPKCWFSPRQSSGPTCSTAASAATFRWLSSTPASLTAHGRATKCCEVVAADSRPAQAGVGADQHRR